MGGVDISLPNVSYCEDVKDVHYNPYNTVEFYVGEITRTTPQTVTITDYNNNDYEVQVNKGNNWYSCVLPKDKELYRIKSGVYDDEDDVWYDGIVTKVRVKADVSKISYHIIPTSIVEASFKGSNTSNVTDMSYMFHSCSNLTSLDVSSFDTSKVTDMNSMFSGCSGLTSLDVSSFDTSNVHGMYNMFNGCSNLTSLDLSNFDTSKVGDMDNMFQDCDSLILLDLSGWDMSKTTTINMFFNCTSLKTIKMIDCSPETIKKITDVKPSSATIVTE